MGGEKEQFEHAKQLLLSKMGITFFHVGKAGSGAAAKLINNMILGVNMCAASEGLAIGTKLGMDPKVLSQICAVSTGKSWCIDTYCPVPGVQPSAPANRNYDDGFYIDL